MKLNLKSVAIAVALAGAAGAADASALSFQPSTGNSSLVLTVFDQSTGKSYFSEIGGAGRLDTINTGTFSLAGLGNFFSGSDPANLFWSVTAGDSLPSSGNQFLGTRILSTIGPINQNTPNIGGSNGTLPFGASANLQSFDTNFCGTVSAGSACTANSSADQTSAARAEWGSDWGSTGVLNGDFYASAASMALWLITPDGEDDFLTQFSAPVGTLTAYTAALNLVAGTLTISSGSAPEVPLPAAVWLFGSALGAMGIIGRRRQRPVAAAA